MQQLLKGAVVGTGILCSMPAYAFGVASAGVCADQLVLPLFPRHAITGVSPQASDASVSLMAEQAKGLPIVKPAAEDLILSGADTVVLNTYGDGKTQALLERLGVMVVRVPYDPHLSDIPTSLRRLGVKLKVEKKSEELALKFQNRLSQVHADQPSSLILAAYYRPDGGSAGLGTYVAEAMEIAGYRSLASSLGHRGWGRLDLEDLILNPPSVFVTSFFEDQAESMRRSFGRHPVLRHAFAEHPVIQIAGKLWGCGGWPVMAAIEAMAEQRP